MLNSSDGTTATDGKLLSTKTSPKPSETQIGVIMLATVRQMTARQTKILSGCLHRFHSAMARTGSPTDSTIAQATQ
jgi:hypothetical protein